MIGSETIRRGGSVVQGFSVGGSTRSSSNPVGVGTVLGLQTVEELDKLIKNKDVEMEALGREAAQSADPSIQADWSKLSQAYQTARAAGLQAVTDGRSIFLPDRAQATWNTDAAYKNIIRALQPVAGQVTPGSKQDIGNRLVAAGWKPAYKLPFPLQADADLTFFKDTDLANLPSPFDFLKWIEAHKTALVVGGVAVGGVVVLAVLAPYARLLSAALPRHR